MRVLPSELSVPDGGRSWSDPWRSNNSLREWEDKQRAFLIHGRATQEPNQDGFSFLPHEKQDSQKTSSALFKDFLRTWALKEVHH